MESLSTTRKKWYANNVLIIAMLFLFFPVGLFLMWKYSTLKKAVKWVITIILATLVIFSFSSSKSTPAQSQQTDQSSTPPQVVAPSPTATNIPEPTETPKPTLTSEQIIANFEKDAKTLTVADIYKSPNSYKGKALIFTCTVSGFPKDSNGDVGGLNCDDLNDFSSNVQVGIDKKTDVTKINQNDIIKVYGMGLGADTGKNAFGADITTGAILGLYINDLTTGYKNY